MQKCQTDRVPHHLLRVKIRSLDDQRCCGQSCPTPSSLSPLTKERSAAHLVAPLPHPLPGVKWWEGRVQSSVYTREEETVRDKSVTVVTGLYRTQRSTLPASHKSLHKILSSLAVMVRGCSNAILYFDGSKMNSKNNFVFYFCLQENAF